MKRFYKFFFNPSRGPDLTFLDFSTSQQEPKQGKKEAKCTCYVFTIYRRNKMIYNLQKKVWKNFQE